MLLLDSSNFLLEERLKGCIAETGKSISLAFCDFDSVFYQLTTLRNDKSKLRLSVKWNCIEQLKKYKLEQVLKTKYINIEFVEPEAGFHFSLVFDVDLLKDSGADLIHKLGLLKCYLFSLAFEESINRYKAKDLKQVPIVVDFRSNSSIAIIPGPDRITAVFSLKFVEYTDIVIGKVMLQEFVDVRKKIQSSPQVIFCYGAKPNDVKNVTMAVDDEQCFYITFVLFPRHYENTTAERTINRLQLFSDDIHYQLNCTKSHLHARMRARCQMFIKILNRARPDVGNVTKKTASGRTFERKT